MRQKSMVEGEQEPSNEPRRFTYTPKAYTVLFEFIELPPFAAMRTELFNDDESYATFQMYLCHHSQAGDVIPGTGGCRKIRWAARGKGKRGGARVIYFVRLVEERIVLVAAYGKGEREDVPRAWLRRLKEVFDHE